jgi:tetratricopeptide (TPR) repeat protein
MKRRLFAAFALGVAAGCSFHERPEDRFTAEISESPAPDIEKRAQQAEDFFRRPRDVEKVKMSLEAALGGVSPGNGYRGLWQAARACAWLAERHPDLPERESYARRGAAVCREGLRLAPDRVEPYFYLALNLGRLSDLLQTTRFLKEMAQNAETAIQKDERFEDAGPHRFLGVLHLMTEGRLLVGFGDLDVALKHLARAAELFPDDWENRANYAEALIVDEDYPRAREELAAAERHPPPDGDPFDRQQWLDRLKTLRAKLK